LLDGLDAAAEGGLREVGPQGRAKSSSLGQQQDVMQVAQFNFCSHCINIALNMHFTPSMCLTRLPERWLFQPVATAHSQKYLTKLETTMQMKPLMTALALLVGGGFNLAVADASHPASSAPIAIS
jgi:uncharacterized membrane protein AbrB (regulator of aidB expression)